MFDDRAFSSASFEDRSWFGVVARPALRRVLSVYALTVQTVAHVWTDTLNRVTVFRR